MILAILQARASSSRLPGKVLRPILNKPMLEWQIERAKRSAHIDQIILATSVDPSDDALLDLGKKLNIAVFRGSLNDVLERFYYAAKEFQPDHVVRLTGDCPLIDPGVIDQTVEYYQAGDYDYVNNFLQPTFPDGLDCEIFKFCVLEEAYKKATLQSEREHVTPYIYKHPERFKIGCYKNTVDLSHLRWTVDQQNDFDVIRFIYEGLYSQNPHFGMNDVLHFLKNNPHIIAKNSSIKRNEGYLKSLERDEKGNTHV